MKLNWLALNASRMLLSVTFASIGKRSESNRYCLIFAICFSQQRANQLYTVSNTVETHINMKCTHSFSWYFSQLYFISMLRQTQQQQQLQLWQITITGNIFRLSVGFICICFSFFSFRSSSAIELITNWGNCNFVNLLCVCMCVCLFFFS